MQRNAYEMVTQEGREKKSHLTRKMPRKWLIILKLECPEQDLNLHDLAATSS
jgi:hypothetical protein